MNFSRIISILTISLTASMVYAASPQHTADAFTSIMSVLNNPGSFSILVSELRASKASTWLEKNRGNEKITLLAPTDTALNAFGQIGALRGTPLHEEFFKFHMLHGIWNRKRLRANRTAKTFSDKPLNLKNIGKILYSIEVDNGMIHIIDTVVLHPEIKKKLKIK